MPRWAVLMFLMMTCFLFSSIHASALQSSDEDHLKVDLSRLTLPSNELNIPSRLRIMVFAPHPDDETLAAGGLIQRVLAKGGTVRVVFITNGDGFLDGVRCEVERQETSAIDFIEYGKRRQEEALRAITELGLQRGDALFFGFPDGGIDDLWAGHWSKLHPYRSPFTHFDQPDYQDCFSRYVKYAGTDLKDQIIRTLQDFEPDWIVMPDPRDYHMDHSTTGVFVLDALRKLRADEGGASFMDTQVFTYLVHYLDYPQSDGWLTAIKKAGVGGGIEGSGILSETQWLSLPITSEELSVKKQALEMHETQFEALYDLLKNFLIHYEMFGRLGPTQAMTLPSDYANRCGRPNS